MRAGRAIRDVSAAAHEDDRATFRVCQGVDFGRAAAARAADGSLRRICSKIDAKYRPRADYFGTAMSLWTVFMDAFSAYFGTQEPASTKRMIYGRFCKGLFSRFN
jgi:hypothetical protein